MSCEKMIRKATGMPASTCVVTDKDTLKAAYIDIKQNEPTEK